MEKKKSNAEFLKWFKPLIEALKELGGSATPEQVRNQIAKDLKLSEEITSETYGKTNSNKFANQVAFARNYLVYAGYIDKSKSGIWVLTESGKIVNMTEELASDIFIENAPKHVKTEKAHLSWIPFYTEFATSLLQYKNNRNKLIEKLQTVFTTIDMPFPKIESDNTVVDIDPFTIFGFFNKHILFEKRVKISEAIKNEFELKEPVPEDFDAIPVVNNLKAAFFYGIKFREKNNDVDNLWEIYEQAINFDLSNTKKFEEYYSKCIEQPGVKWNLSMGLFWIRPDTFIPLDSNTRNHLADKFNIIIKKPISGTEYVELLKKLKGESFTELSGDAWTDKDIYTDEDDGIHYWIYAPGENACMWDDFYKKGIMALGWGEISNLRDFESREDIRIALQEVWPNTPQKHSSLALWQFANEMKVGDVIFVKKGMYKILGRGVVESEYEYSEDDNEYKHVRKVNWTHNEEKEHPGQAVLKTLTDITQYTEYVQKLNSLYDVEEQDIEEKISQYEPYSKTSFLNEVFMSEEKYETIQNILLRKKNIILQGAPGVGKTFAAKRFAYSLLGEKNTERVKMVQFHQSYSYEDFIVGFRPSEDKDKQFEKKYGVFYNFCQKAKDDDVNNPYFFIIDEINRGNMSKIFGELLMLIESDKRGAKNKLQLLYSNEEFYVPENVYIIGMMNTADRSLAVIDYALRRRFAFIDFEPGFNTDGFEALQLQISNDKYNKLIEQIILLNEYIADDPSLGKGFIIGHSYFVPKTTSEINDKWLKDVINYEIVPMLEEYWFDETDKLETWKQNLLGAVK